ncbi:MAG: multicopper oxidase domain-containing protein [Polyangiaceae bacterium]|nr:multicopper oxidase domain-containing protein [Polyangiaceae bacterium]
MARCPGPELDGRRPRQVQPPVEPGGTFTYELVLKDAGTFWFHPHVRSSEQVERGLYGVLIVEDVDPPPFTREVLWVLDDFKLDDSGQISAAFNTRHDLAHDGRWGTSSPSTARRTRRSRSRGASAFEFGSSTSRMGASFGWISGASTRGVSRSMASTHGSPSTRLRWTSRRVTASTWTSPSPRGPPWTRCSRSRIDTCVAQAASRGCASPARRRWRRCPSPRLAVRFRAGQRPTRPP